MLGIDFKGDKLNKEELKNELKNLFIYSVTSIKSIFIIWPLFLALIYYAIFYTENVFQLITLVVFSFLISISSIQDFKEKMTFTFFLYPMFLCVFYINDINNIFKSLGLNLLLGFGFILFLSLLTFIVTKIKKKDSLGLGDVPVFFALIIICSPMYISYCLIIMALGGILYHIITKEEHIPLIPFMQLGLVLTLFFKSHNTFFHFLF